ncbi:hypothetical protein [Marinicellulosiphila megalodicopiae]|uniref:hypothetical protein n=1 Tax=Marinicellulosiphila megalodicopiae TaxID=2724896 RepID=UPI003BB03DD1
MQNNYLEHEQQNDWQRIIFQSEHLKEMAISENWENFLSASKKHSQDIERYFRKHSAHLSTQLHTQKDIASLIKTDQFIQQVLSNKNQQIAKELLHIQKRKFAENAYHFMHLTH